MTLHLWLSFVVASMLLLLMPGPTVLQCIGDALSSRRSQHWKTILGVGLGDSIAMSLSMLGAGAVLQASAKAFFVMKAFGGCYLIGLGCFSIVKTWKNGEQILQPAVKDEIKAGSGWHRFARVSTVTMLNPKSILFFVAFVPQFIAGSGSFMHQALLLLGTFVGLSMLNAWGYMSAAERFSRHMTSAKSHRRIGYASGGMLMVAGGVTLALRKH